MTDKVAYHPLEDDNDDEASASQTARWHEGPTSMRKALLQWSRLMVEVVLVAIIFFLGVRLMLRNSTGYQGPNDPKKHFGFIDKTFMNESRYANEEAFLSKEKLAETLKNWVPLSSTGRGYVEIPSNERNTLESPPYVMNPLMRPNKKELYMISGFHQLHCLSTIMASYARLRYGEDESKMGFHIAHCFDYLREGIICAGDSTLEGNNSAKYPGVEIPWGTSHRCANWDAMREWADQHTAFPFPPGLDTGI